MNTGVILIEMVAFAAIFTAIIFAYYRGDRKYSPASIHNYPPDIQAEYFKTHERVDVSYKSKNVLLTKGFGVLLFTGILLVCIGPATRQAETLQKHDKEYIADIVLGATTPSYDLEKEIDRRYPYEQIDAEALRSVLPSL